MTGYAFEIEAHSCAVVSEDRQEGINAFSEKRMQRAMISLSTRVILTSPLGERT